MEYVFFVAVAFSVWMYLLDRKGWNATAKRISTIVRANLESGKAVKALEPVKDHDDWEQKFKAIENPPSAALKPIEKPSRHVIVKRDWYETQVYGLWPQWHCKCGAKGHEPRGGRSMEVTKRAALLASEKHVREATESDELKAKTGGKFAW